MVSRIVYTFFKSQSERLVHVFTVELKTILSNKKNVQAYLELYTTTLMEFQKDKSVFLKNSTKNIYMSWIRHYNVDDLNSELSSLRLTH